MLNKLRDNCEKLIATDKEKYLLIKNILEDDECFFKMDIETAYSILRDLKVEEKALKVVYAELIKHENFTEGSEL